MPHSIKGYMTRAAIYCRISRDTERDALGVERQRQVCLAYVKQNGWTVVFDGTVDTFTDNDISGAKDTGSRPAFARLTDAIKAGKVDAVVAYSQARIYRDTKKVLGFLETCKDAGVQKIGLVADAEINPGGSLFLATVIAAKDAEERRRISELVRLKKLELAERGLPSGSGRAFGYAKDGTTVVEAEAAMIRAAAKKVLNGETIASIRDEWRASGVPPVKSGVWGSKSVRNALVRPRYVGLRQHQGAVFGDAKWDAILDRETWEQVQVVLTNPARRNVPMSNRYPLKGLLVCGKCGNPMPAMPRGHTRMYGCRKSLGNGRCGQVQVTAERIEEFVIPILRTLANAQKIRDLLESESEANTEELRTLLTEKAKQENLLAGLEDKRAREEISAQGVARNSKFFRQQIDALAHRIAIIRGSSALGRLGPDLDLEAAWPKMSVDQRQQVMKMLVSHIKVNRQLKGGNRFDPKRVEFVWRSGALPQAVGFNDDGELDLDRFMTMWGSGTLARAVGRDPEEMDKVISDSAEALGRERVEEFLNQRRAPGNRL